MRTLTADVVVVGGGAAGLLTAAAARASGLEVVCVEATSTFGGSTAADIGQVWLPATHLAARLGGPDSTEAASEYLDAVLGDTTPASSEARRAAFVGTAGELAAWLESRGVALNPVRGRVDFHPGLTQARRGGRVLAAPVLDRRLLGPVAPLLRQTDYDLEIAPRSPRAVLTAAQAMAHRLLNPTKDAVQGGSALAGRLLLLASQLGVVLRPGVALTDLIADADRVRGVRLRHDDQEVEVRANAAVILCCGGFEGNDEMRQEYLPLPTRAEWTSGLDSNAGAGILAAARLGAQLAEMNQAWWTIVARLGGKTYRMTSERSTPHGIVVDSAGDRFFDEAGVVPEAGWRLYERSRRVRSIPAYLILDNRHRQRYRLGPWLPGSSPADSGEVVSAQSIAELADRLRVDQAGLIGSVVRFNGFAAKGRDGDFQRGASVADRVHGDPLYRKNPNLGGVERSPFWAVRVYPGDAGTKGGLLTDADARVLRADGSPIPGLYATAGTAASLFKATAPGPGCALASALVEGYRAVAHLTGSLAARDTAG